jgi:hypothetical protein
MTFPLLLALARLLPRPAQSCLLIGHTPIYLLLLSRPRLLLVRAQGHLLLPSRTLRFYFNLLNVLLRLLAHLLESTPPQLVLVVTLLCLLPMLLLLLLLLFLLFLLCILLISLNPQMPALVILHLTYHPISKLFLMHIQLLIHRCPDKFALVCV